MYSYEEASVDNICIVLEGKLETEIVIGFSSQDKSAIGMHFKFTVRVLILDTINSGQSPNC